jgi:hypothetical protein
MDIVVVHTGRAGATEDGRQHIYERQSAIQLIGLYTLCTRNTHTTTRQTPGPTARRPRHDTCVQPPTRLRSVNMDKMFPAGIKIRCLKRGCRGSRRVRTCAQLPPLYSHSTSAPARLVYAVSFWAVVKTRTIHTCKYTP